VWATNYLWLKLWLGVTRNLTWCTTKFVVSSMGGKNYWFLSLTICKSMQEGGNARLDILNLLWGTILCLLIINMPRMKGY
jgi:hypothetical protein